MLILKLQKEKKGMQLSGMLYGSKILKLVDFPASEVLGPDASKEELKDLLERKGLVFIKPLFKGGVGKKGKSGLLGKATNLDDLLKEKERLYFAEHKVHDKINKANGVSFEGGVPADIEVYVSITNSTRHRAPILTITHHGGVDIEELDSDKIAVVPFDPLVGLTGHIIQKALAQINAPKELISSLVQHLPKLWEAYNGYGMTTLEVNPIRMQSLPKGRFLPVACDFKCGFDQDDTRYKRLGLPDELFQSDLDDFEEEINELRTYQGQSDVYTINEDGTILAPTFGGGANSLVSELLGSRAIFSSDFAGNPPYEKMYAVAKICYKHWLKQTNVLFIIGGRANNTDIYVTFRAMADALREYYEENGPVPIYVVVGRGGPRLIQGMSVMRETLDSLEIPYRFFGFDSAMSEVVSYAKKVDSWMRKGGREQIEKRMKKG